MAENPHHEHLVRELAEIFQPVLDNSPQAIYLYLDDEHKICNRQFADLLGYSSVREWVENKAPLADVVPDDQDKIIKAYSDASENYRASVQKVSLAKDGGKPFRAEVIMVPVSYKDEVFVLHFISV